MKDEDRSRDELIAELEVLRERNRELEEESADSSGRVGVTAVEALRRSRAQLRTTMNSIPFDFFAIDTSGRYFLQNTTCREHWGNVVGRCPRDLEADAESIRIWEDNNRRALSGEIVSEETSYLVDGERRHVFNILSPIRDGDRIDGIVGINIDITDRKAAEIAVEQKNMAMKEIMAQIEEEKLLIRKSVEKNVQKVVVPMLNRLKTRCSARECEYIDAITSTLNIVASEFSAGCAGDDLTKRECEVCALLRAGLSSKQIAEQLDLTVRTVDTHRNNIRRKLKLSGKQVNLVTYLRSLHP